MHVIQLHDYVADQLQRAGYVEQRRRLPWIALGLGTLALLMLLIGRASRAPLAVEVGAALAVLALAAAAAVGVYAIAYRSRSSQRDQWQAGLAGQQVVPQALAGLDDRYYLINNVKLPGRGDDVDHLVVGPNGVFALETKHHRGRILCRDGQWYQAKTSRSGWAQPEVPMRDPVQQLKRNVDYLRRCITATDERLSRRTRLWIEGAVVFTHPDARIELSAELLASLTFPVLRVGELAAHIAGHVPRQPLAQAEVRHIVSLLAHLRAPGDEAPASSGAGMVGTRASRPSAAKGPGPAPRHRGQ